nr:hypothetical protein CFP56_64593 [Quercus suber]
MCCPCFPFANGDSGQKVMPCFLPSLLAGCPAVEIIMQYGVVPFHRNERRCNTSEPYSIGRRQEYDRTWQTASSTNAVVRLSYVVKHIAVEHVNRRFRHQ